MPSLARYAHLYSSAAEPILLRDGTNIALKSDLYCSAVGAICLCSLSLGTLPASPLRGLSSRPRCGGDFSKSSFAVPLSCSESAHRGLFAFNLYCYFCSHYTKGYTPLSPSVYMKGGVTMQSTPSVESSI